MRLHLNKTLRAALIAAITVVGTTLPQAEADIQWNGKARENDWFYTNSGGPYTLLDTEHSAIMLTAEGSCANATTSIDSITTKSGATVHLVPGNHWGSTRTFKDLQVEKIKAGTDGQGAVLINTEPYASGTAADSCVATVKAVEGTLAGVDNYTILTIGTDGSSINASGTLLNHEGATLTLNGSYSFDTTDATGYTLKTAGTTGWTDADHQQGFVTSKGSSYYVIKGATEGTGFAVTTAEIEKESSGNYYFTAGDVTDTTKFYVKAATATLDHDGTGQIVVEKAGATVTVQNAKYRDTSGSKNLNIVVEDKGVLEITHSGGNGYVTGDITINGGGTFRVAGQHDAFGWGGGTTKNIILQGENGNVATLDFQQTTGNSATFNAALKMMGYAAITGAKGFNTHDGSFYAEGLNNTIESFQIRHAATFEVKEGGELTVGTMTRGQDGNKTLTKEGLGTITFTTKAQANGLVVNAGKVVISGGTENSLDSLVIGEAGMLEITGGTTTVGGTSNVISNTIELTGGELKLGGTYDLSGLELQGGGTNYVNGDSPYIAAGNGFAQSTGSLNVVHVEGGTLTLLEGAVFNYNAAPVTVGANGVATLPGTTSYSALYVNNGDGVSFNAAWNIAQEHSTDITGVVMANGTNIDLDKEEASIGLTLKGGATLKAAVDTATTISSITGWQDNTLTVTGEGAVILAVGDRTLTGTTKLDVQGKATTNKILLNSDEASLVVGTTGDLTLSGSNLTPTKGTVDISGKVYVGNEIDLSNGSKSTGKITLHTGADVTVKDGMWMYYTSQGILLEEGAKLAVTGKGVKFTGKEGGLIKAADGKEIYYQASNDNAVIKNVIMEATDNITIANQLTNVDLVTGEYTMTLNKTIAVGTGTLGLDGTFAIGGIAGTEVASYAGGDVQDNGFKTSTTTRAVYTKEEGGVVTVAQGSVFKVGDNEVELRADGTAVTDNGTDYTKFYVNSGTEKVSKAFESHEPAAFQLAASTTLQVDQSVAAAVRGAGATSVVTIDSDRVLTGTAQNVALTGAGTYVLDANTQTLGTGVTLGDGWQGAVQLSGSINNIKFDASALGNHVEVCGLSGYFYDLTIGGRGTYAGTLTLTNPEAGTPALLINNGFSRDNAYYELSGAVDGSGTWRFDKGDATVTNRIIFSGNTADWVGAIELTKGFTVELTFAQTNGEMGAAITRNGGTLNMIVGNADGQSTVFNQDVTASALTVNEGATATFQGDATFNSLSGTGKVALDKDAKLTVSGEVAEGVKIDAADGATIDAEIDTTQVGIAAEATATFAQGIQDTAGVGFYGEEGVQVKNTGGESIHYAIDVADAQVTADTLFAGNNEAVVVDNALVVDTITHIGTGALTLTKVDEDALTTVSTESADLTIKGITETSLTDLSIGTGATVAVYTDEYATTEGTVTITDTLTAGGATLLANLTLVGREGDELLSWNLNGTQMTLGSTLTLNTDSGLIQLDNETMLAIAALRDRGEYVELVLNGGESLGYQGKEWFDGVFSRTYTNEEGLKVQLGGDYNVKVLDNGNFGIVKFSNVPEPTTGTLSLLALMALAARRRKH